MTCRIDVGYKFASLPDAIMALRPPKWFRGAALDHTHRTSSHMFMKMGNDSEKKVTLIQRATKNGYVKFQHIMGGSIH